MSTTIREQLAFTLRVQAALSGDGAARDRTLCWSPYSVAAALGLAATGAAGKTRRELVDLLTVDPQELAAMLSAAALDTRGAESDALFRVSSTLWADRRAGLRTDYPTGLSGWPGGSVRTQGFAADPEAARERINGDVRRTTNGLIPEVLAPGSVDRGTVAVLVTALYLKLAWTHRFPEHATADAPFHAPDGSRDVPTMRLGKRLRYRAAAGWQAATLPVEQGVEAVLLLPDAELAEAEPRLDGAALDELLAGGEPRPVQLHVPKFRLQEHYPLERVLRTLGVTAMFDETAADFGPMFDGEAIAVDSVEHQAVLRVDEHGIEGAAATAMRFEVKAMVRGPEPLVLRFDRPFLFFVRHRQTGVIYFSARVTDVR